MHRTNGMETERDPDRPTSAASGLARTPEPPYWAVIFTDPPQPPTRRSVRRDRPADDGARRPAARLSSASRPRAPTSGSPSRTGPTRRRSRRGSATPITRSRSTKAARVGTTPTSCASRASSAPTASSARREPGMSAAPPERIDLDDGIVAALGDGRRRRGDRARGRREPRAPEAVDAVGRRAVGRRRVPTRPAPRTVRATRRGARSGSTGCSRRRRHVPRLDRADDAARSGHARDRLLAARRRRAIAGSRRRPRAR